MRDKQAILQSLNSPQTPAQLQIELLCDIRDQLVNVDTSIAMLVKRISEGGDLYKILDNRLDALNS